MERNIEDLRRELERGDVEAARRLYRLSARHGDAALSARALEVLRHHRAREQPIQLLDLDALRLPGESRRPRLTRSVGQDEPSNGAVTTCLAVDAAGELLVAVRADGSAGICQMLDGSGRLELGDLEMRCEGVLTHALAPFVIVWGRCDGVLYYRAVEVRSGRLLPRHAIPGGRHMALGALGAAYVVVERRTRARLAGEPQRAARRDPWTHEVWEVPNVIARPRPLARGAQVVGAWRGTCVSPWGQWLYEPDARSDRNVRLWSTLRDEVVALPTAGHFVDLVAVVHDDTRVLVVDHRGTRSRLRLFELPGARPIEEIEFDGILRPACLGAGDHLLGLSLGRLHVWSTHALGAGDRVVPMPARTLGLHHELACDPAAHVVAIADGQVLQTTDLERLPRSLELATEQGRLSTALLADAANRLLVEDGHRVSLVDLEGAAHGRLVQRIIADDGARKRAFAISPDARRTLWCQADGQGPRLVLFDTDRDCAPRQVSLLRPVAASAIHPSGRWFAVATHPADSEVELFSWHSLARVGHFEVANRVYLLAFSPDGRWLALASGAGELQLWDLERGPRRLAHGVVPMRGMYDVVQAVGFDARGAMLASMRGAVHRLDASGCFTPEWMPQPEEDARVVVFSPGGRFLALRVRQNRVRIVDLGHDGACAGELIVGMPDALLLSGQGRLVELELAARRLAVHEVPDLDDPLPPRVELDLAPLEPTSSWSRLEGQLPEGLCGDAALVYRELEADLDTAAQRLSLTPEARHHLAATLLPRAARMLDATQSLLRVSAAADLKEAMRSMQTRTMAPPAFPGPPREITAELLFTEPTCLLCHRLQPGDLSFDRQELIVLRALTGHEVFTPRGQPVIDELARQVAFERAVIELRTALPIGFDLDALLRGLRGLACATSLGALVVLSTIAMRRPEPAPLLQLVVDPAAALEQRAAAIACAAGLGFDSHTLARIEAHARESEPLLWPAVETLWEQTRRYARLAGLLPL